MKASAWLPRVLIVAVMTSGCARAAEVVTDPGSAAPAVLVVANQTDVEILVELMPADEPTGNLTLGQVPPGEATAFENVPARRPFTLRASVPGTTRMLTGPTRSFEPTERWEWLVRPTPEWGFD